MSLENYHEILERNAVMKRFNERWIADPQFRSDLAEDAAGTLAAKGLECTPEDIAGDADNPSAATRAMWQIVHAKSKHIAEFYRAAEPLDWRIRGWRDRQIKRQRLDLGPFHVNSNIHASFAVELTQGCSVGCWFCALSPGRLNGVFARTPENRRLWRASLQVLADVLGPAAQTGFLYWASDPLDNPDYIELACDFHEVIGVFPPTTTALALRDPALTRRLLAVSRERGCWLNRFSVVTLKLLDRIHREFTSEELAHVECLAVNRESAFAFGNSGRFRERAARDPSLLEKQRSNLNWAPWYTGDRAYADTDDYPLASIGCLTGFLINMVDQTVQLVTPCTADDRWPDGSHILAEERFTDAASLEAAIERIIETHMSSIVRPGDRVLLPEWMTVHDTDTGIVVEGRFSQQIRFDNSSHADLWHAVGRAARKGGKGSEIVAALSDEGSDARVVQAMLDALLQAGVLDETPEPASAPECAEAAS